MKPPLSTKNMTWRRTRYNRGLVGFMMVLIGFISRRFCAFNALVSVYPTLPSATFHAGWFFVLEDQNVCYGHTVPVSGEYFFA